MVTKGFKMNGIGSRLVLGVEQLGFNIGPFGFYWVSIELRFKTTVLPTKRTKLETILLKFRHVSRHGFFYLRLPQILF